MVITHKPLQCDVTNGITSERMETEKNSNLLFISPMIGFLIQAILTKKHKERAWKLINKYPQM